MKFLFLLLPIFFSPKVSARPIELNVRDYGWLTSFPPLKDVLDFYVAGEEDDLNLEQPILDPSRINYGTANSSVLASKGLGTDYVNDPKRYSLSLGLGAAWDAEKNEGIKDEISGAAASSALTFGYRMNEKLLGYVSFGVIKHNQSFPGKDVDIAGDIKGSHFGLHLRYDLIEKKGSDFFGWGGLKLSGGYEYTKNRVDLTTTLDEPLELDTGGQGILEGRITGNPVYQVKTTTHSLPIELSSSFLFLNIFSLYGGAGADLNFGSSVGKGKIEGDVATLACTSGICVGETVLPQLEARANFDSRSTVKTMTFRGFGGLQLDLPFGLNAFGQVEQMIGTKVIGLSTGLRYIY
ncbi:MAG: hypothetical protein V4598_09650 [Bdellovibrionota bacterium]